MSAEASHNGFALALADLPIYFVVISASCMTGVAWSYRRAARLGFDRKIAMDAAVLVMALGFVGGRALHVAWERPDLYLRDPVEVLRFWHGGFVFFGGALAAFAGAAWMIKLRGESVLRWADFFAPVGALAYGLGRVACWLAGCCYGRLCRLDEGHAFRLPTQAFAVAWELAATLALLWLESARVRWTKGGRLRERVRDPGGVFFAWTFVHSVGRLAMEAMRDDDRGPRPLGLGISSWISLALLAASTGWFLRGRLGSRG